MCIKCKHFCVKDIVFIHAIFINSGMPFFCTDIMLKMQECIYIYILILSVNVVRPQYCICIMYICVFYYLIEMYIEWFMVKRGEKREWMKKSGIFVCISVYAYIILNLSSVQLKDTGVPFIHTLVLSSSLTSLWPELSLGKRWMPYM